MIWEERPRKKINLRGRLLLHLMIFSGEYWTDNLFRRTRDHVIKCSILKGFEDVSSFRWILFIYLFQK